MAGPTISTFPHGNVKVQQQLINTIYSPKNLKSANDYVESRPNKLDCVLVVTGETHHTLQGFRSLLLLIVLGQQ